MLEDDLAELAVGVSEGRLKADSLSWKNQAATCVVMASEGYPGPYEKGMEISGLDTLDGMETVFAFQADTVMCDGKLFTNGGRILGITALADNLQESINKAYEVVEQINFKNQYFRRDIGSKGLLRTV